MSSNKAAWLIDKSGNALEVKPSAYVSPKKNEVLVKNGAIAINPLDWLLQLHGSLMFPWLKYPAVLGSDLAGEIAEVGEGVTRFKVGDRVLGHAVSIDKESNQASEGAFQEYTILRVNLVSPIPVDIPYANACVVPLGLSTAACGLFQKDYLNLKYPLPNGGSKSTGQTVLIWGASTSVGSNAIQLAVAAGYEVIATASPKNFQYVKSLGATEVFNYRSDTVNQDIIEAFKGRQSAGALAIGTDSMSHCITIIGATKGKKFVAQASAIDFPKDKTSSGMAILPIAFSFLCFSISTWVRSKMNGVSYKFIFGNDLMRNEVGNVIYESYLPEALVGKRFKFAPEPVVVGAGLKSIQKALNAQKNGVSAQKVVVTL